MTASESFDDPTTPRPDNWNTTRKVARSATSGRFISARDASRWAECTVVETITCPPRRPLLRRRRWRKGENGVRLVYLVINQR